MAPNQPIELSVIIASHNRRELLRRCLESLSRQTEDFSSFEVIVADDGSTDGTAEMAEALETPYRLRVLRREHAGKTAMQNAALEIVEAPVCLLLDDDVIAEPELVAAHLAGQRANPLAIGIGTLVQVPPAARDWYAHSYATGWNEHYEDLQRRPALWTDCYGGNFSCPREKLLEVGGTVDVDVELAHRLCQVGCVPTYLPRAKGIHDDQKPGRKMILDAQRQGKRCVELARRFPGVEAELLSWSEAADPRELAIRRIMMALRMSPTGLAWFGRFVPGSRRKMYLFHIIRRIALWKGARRNMSHIEWKLLTHGGENVL